MPNIENYIAQNRPNFNRASIDRQHFGNVLMRNEVDRIPQTNKAQDLGIRAAEQAINQRGQQFTDEQKTNARMILSRGFGAIRQSSLPRLAAQQFFASPDFQAAGKLVGIPVEYFAKGSEMTDDQTLLAGVADWERILGGDVQEAVRYEQFTGPDGSMLQRGPNNQVTTLLGREPQGPTPSSGPQPPSGYRFKPDGSLEPTPGGPADPSAPGSRRNAMPLRKEYEDQEAVKNYRSVLPLYERAASAPDNRAGDISVIYALGKMFDPTSVVREGELQLSMDAAPWMQKLAASINSQITGEGRLSPAMRADIMQALGGQLEALRPAFEQERQRYSSYATESGFSPDSVVGPDPAVAFPPSAAQSGGWSIRKLGP